LVPPPPFSFYIFRSLSLALSFPPKIKNRTRKNTPAAPGTSWARSSRAGASSPKGCARRASPTTSSSCRARGRPRSCSWRRCRPFKGREILLPSPSRRGWGAWRGRSRPSRSGRARSPPRPRRRSGRGRAGRRRRRRLPLRLRSRRRGRGFRRRRRRRKRLPLRRGSPAPWRLGAGGGLGSRSSSSSSEEGERERERKTFFFLYHERNQMTTNDGNFYISSPQARAQPRVMECPLLAKDRQKKAEGQNEVCAWVGPRVFPKSWGKGGGWGARGAAQVNRWRPSLSPNLEGDQCISSGGILREGLCVCGGGGGGRRAEKRKKRKKTSFFCRRARAKNLSSAVFFFSSPRVFRSTFLLLFTRGASCARRLRP